MGIIKYLSHGLVHNEVRQFHFSAQNRIYFLEKNITRNSNILATEMQYCPISIIISSYYANVDFFKELLKKFYKIIRFDSSIITNYCEKKSNSYINNTKNNPFY